MTNPANRKLSPALIAAIHNALPPDAPVSDISLVARLCDLSYSTVWHVVRGYCRHASHPWPDDTDFPESECAE